ncbi:MAG: hypothetical protein ACKVQW_02400, partial [Pyrinomonadaceae bacterium]
QALVSEIYQQQVGDEICMAFSSCGAEFVHSPHSVDLNMASLAVRSAATTMERILTTKMDIVRQRIRVLLSSSRKPFAEPFFAGSVPQLLNGQQVVADHLLNNLRN